MQRGLVRHVTAATFRNVGPALPGQVGLGLSCSPPTAPSRWPKLSWQALGPPSRATKAAAPPPTPSPTARRKAAAPSMSLGVRALLGPISLSTRLHGRSSAGPVVD